MYPLLNLNLYYSNTMKCIMSNSKGIERQTYDRWFIWSISWLSHWYLQNDSLFSWLSHLYFQNDSLCTVVGPLKVHYILLNKYQSLHSVLHNIYKIERFHIKIVKLAINKELKIYTGKVSVSNLKEKCYTGQNIFP